MRERRPLKERFPIEYNKLLKKMEREKCMICSNIGFLLDESNGGWEDKWRDLGDRWVKRIGIHTYCPKCDNGVIITMDVWRRKKK